LRRVNVFVLGLGVLVLAGCTAGIGVTGSDGTLPTPSPTTPQQEVIVAMLRGDDAQPTMSDEQRETLLEILATGEVTFEQYQDAVNRTLDCATDAGLKIDGPRTVDQGGQPTITWGWSDPAQPDGDPKLGEYCRNVHSLGVEQAYLNSDVALEDERRQLEAYRPQIVACYADNGAPLDDPDMDIFDMLNDYESLGGTRAGIVESCINELDIVVIP